MDYFSDEWFGDTSPEIVKIIRASGYIAITDPLVVRSFCQEAIALNGKLAAQYRKGSKKVLGKLIGDVMRLTNFGVEPPEMIKVWLEEEINTVIVVRTGKRHYIRQVFLGKKEGKPSDYYKLNNGTLYWEHELRFPHDQI